VDMNIEIARLTAEIHLDGRMTVFEALEEAKAELQGGK